MGWVTTHREKGTTNEEWFRRELIGVGTHRRFLATATVNGVFYAAVEDETTEQVWALVCLTQWVPNDHHNFGYKDMDEGMGPCEDRCPTRILDLLTPTDSEWANQWRQRCRDYQSQRAKARGIKPGTRIRFEHPISFVDGSTLDTFALLKGSQFVSVGGGGYGTYRITNWRDRHFEVVA